ncbi:probable receptor-like protein kinase At5g18500 [Neltuma alba]|uniref:probable receptor-like protein kinase At5g18500 n=1 Tax=Neltuma alba TaxID=207710 RepID=UPI0010A49A3A|nr:probable receptor-like protein kinase At5g18500 [Prosopis alba]XP_028787470.1 probable receptor-like protein kinase At5g18500 [Prosopis alba]XP_028787471.1 probable receptor-like protein kinase At5g18500 [Prosopis alba]
MTVERGTVLVGIRIDSQSRQLLNWALVKVAQPGDCVVAVHVVKCPGQVSKNKPLLDNYLEVYDGLCDVKKVSLIGQIFGGRSVRNILVRESKNNSALALVVGGGAATAKHCAKRLPPTTDVVAIHDGRIVFRRCTNLKLPGLIQDPRPSLTSMDDKEFLSEYGDSEVATVKSLFYEETREDVPEFKEVFGGVKGSKKGYSRAISLFVGDPCEQKLGWPLLRRVNSEISETPLSRNLSVVQWVMNLPDRSPKKSSCFSSTEESLSERGISDVEDDRQKNSSRSLSFELPKDLEAILDVNSFDCKWFNIEDLKSWTSQFSSGNLIGKGGSNRVYKGILPDGKPIAVKVLQSSKEACRDFAQEVEIISSLKHKYITPLLGICVAENALISVYEFFPKGSLEENLHGENKDGSILSWQERFNMAVGIAEALNYLHNETSKPVIHRDVKSSNILLSHELEPQLTDFGLAIWGPTSSYFLTQEDVVGTFGYLAPEYFMYGKLSDKIDVYAFGVVLLELISGKKPISSEICKGQRSLVAWAKPIIESGNIKGLLDSNLEGKFDEVQMQRMVKAANLCITRAARLRPKMNQILKILEGEERDENFLSSQGFDSEHTENQENIDDEVYPNSSAELHLSLALLDVDDDSTSNSSSTERSNSLSLEEHLKERWSRSSSFD